jgi:glycosyltransferase involved in cell wall biosynthesis
VKAAVDATHVTRQPSGARTRLLCLYTRIARMEEIRLKIFIHSASELGDPFREAGAEVVETGHRIPVWRRAFRSLNPVARCVESGLFVQETLPVPRMRRVPLVVTIHDLRFLRKPLRPLLAANLARAYAVVTVSEAMKIQIEKACPQGRIEVVHNGVPPLPAAEGGTEEPCLLYLGHLEPRKNIADLVKAFALFRKKVKGYRLVLAGQPQRGYTGRRVRRWAEEEGIDYRGPVSEEEKGALLRSARLVIQPSRYEGFGMGVLEGLALGKPVACSDIAAHREVAGACALYFPSDRPEAMAHAMERGLLDEGLRSTLSAGGPVRAAAFSWDRSARKLVSLWQEAYSSSG